MTDLDPTIIIFSILFGVIGIGYFSYGKKQNFYFTICGVLLMLYPYFFSSIAAIISIGIALLILPFILTKVN